VVGLLFSKKAYTAKRTKQETLGSRFAIAPLATQLEQQLKSRHNHNRQATGLQTSSKKSFISPILPGLNCSISFSLSFAD
jgi:hypothetical protein